jgi:hypothetical protein
MATQISDIRLGSAELVEIFDSFCPFIIDRINFPNTSFGKKGPLAIDCLKELPNLYLATILRNLMGVSIPKPTTYDTLQTLLKPHATEKLSTITIFPIDILYNETFRRRLFIHFAFEGLKELESKLACNQYIRIQHFSKGEMTDNKLKPNEWKQAAESYLTSKIVPTALNSEKESNEGLLNVMENLRKEIEKLMSELMSLESSMWGIAAKNEIKEKKASIAEKESEYKDYEKVLSDKTVLNKKINDAYSATINILRNNGVSDLHIRKWFSYFSKMPGDTPSSGGGGGPTRAAGSSMYGGARRTRRGRKGRKSHKTHKARKTNKSRKNRRHQ